MQHWRLMERYFLASSTKQGWILLQWHQSLVTSQSMACLAAQLFDCPSRSSPPTPVPQPDLDFSYPADLGAVCFVYSRSLVQKTGYCPTSLFELSWLRFLTCLDSRSHPAMTCAEYSHWLGNSWKIVACRIVLLLYFSATLGWSYGVLYLLFYAESSKGQFCSRSCGSVDYWT